MTASLPSVYWITQDQTGPVVDDPAVATSDALVAVDLTSLDGIALDDRARLEPGQRVAVAVGSRGIADLVPVVRATVDHLRSIDLDPFVVPAMGSHGGGTTAGQEALLAGHGITAEAVGCPVRSQMDTVAVAHSPLGFSIHTDRLAAEADHVVVVNRVKPHTSLSGSIESGLAKMVLVGLGNQHGAATIHRATFDYSWDDIVATSLPAVLARRPVLAAVAVTENAQDQTAHVDAVRGRDILATEPALLDRARSLLPRLPFDDLDIVLIDRIGKDISGTGFDTNVLGRKGAPHAANPDRPPRVGTVVVRGLSPGSGGNALGLGLAELCHDRVVEAMDVGPTRLNAHTSGNLAAAMVPVHLATDRELIEACAARTGLRSLTEARLCWIRDTLDLSVVACSATLLDEVRARPDLTVLDGPHPLPFDAAGNLPDLLPLPEPSGH